MWGVSWGEDRGGRAHKDTEIESLHRQDSSSYLPDKSLPGL